MEGSQIERKHPFKKNTNKCIDGLCNSSSPSFVDIVALAFYVSSLDSRF